MIGGVVARREVIERPVRFGTAELIPDRWRPDGWTVAVDGVAQSYVDLADPTYLEIPFTSWIARVVDRQWPAGQAVSAVHVGGAGLTVPRYVAATRPGSSQIVFELDGELVKFVVEHLGLVGGVEVRVGDGQAGVVGLGSAVADLVVVDVFRGGDVVVDMATVEFLRQTSRVLRAGGLYVANVWDGGELTFARRFVESVREVYANVVVLSEAGVFLRSRPGNVVLVGSDGPLPMGELGEHRDEFFCLAGGQVAALYGDVSPVREGDPVVEVVDSVRRWGGGSRFR